MSNQIIWITGASSGIGEALAYAYAREGAKLILSARRTEELERVAAHCGNPDGLLLLPLDLEDHASLPGKVGEVIRKFGRIDLLINNAGISQRSRAEETDMAVVKRLMDVNYFGTVALSMACLPFFIQQKSGHIAVVTSLVGKFGSPMRSAYSASKHALHGFFDSLRAEHFHDNLKVTLICPGFVRTNITFNALTGDGTAQNKMDDATNQGLDPERCARIIVRGIAKGKEEIYPAGPELRGVYVKRFFPKLFSKLIRKAKVT